MGWSKWIEVNLDALRHNLNALKSLVPKETEFLPVIKSEAYGHGLVPVAKTLVKQKIYGFGISDPEEALELRKTGFGLPLLLLSGFEPHWLDEVVRLRLIPAVVSLRMLKELLDYSLKKAVTFDIHLKVNTGMNRFGIDLEELDEALGLLKKNPQLRLKGVMSHFACAEEPESELTQLQVKNFEKVVSKVTSCGFSPKFYHMANSAGIIFMRGRPGNMVRPGLSLYGVYPSRKARAYTKLRPVMTFKTRILELRRVKAGEGIGYGPIYRTKTPKLVAIVPVGYDDGYPRALSNKGFAVVRGKRAKVIGAVSMRCLFLDVTEVVGVNPGDEVILLGGEREEVPVEELAELAGTISYELLCAVGRRNERIYRDV